MTGFKLIGLKLDKKTTNEGGQSNIDCGGLWQKFEARDFAGQIPNKLGDEIYAVYFDYDGDHTQPFSYFIGCKVDRYAEVPKNMDCLVIPEQNYFKTTAKGQMPNCISSAWKDIWDSKTDRLFTFDFEVYDKRSRDWSDAEVDIFVASTNGKNT